MNTYRQKLIDQAFERMKPKMMMNGECVLKGIKFIDKHGERIIYDVHHTKRDNADGGNYLEIPEATLEYIIEHGETPTYCKYREQVRKQAERERKEREKAALKRKKVA